MPTPIDTNPAFRQLARAVAEGLLDAHDIGEEPPGEAVQAAKALLELLGVTERPG